MKEAQFKILKILSKRKTPITGLSLWKDKLKNMARGTYGPNMGTIVSSGLVTSKRCKTNGKNKLYTITEKGRAALVDNKKVRA